MAKSQASRKSTPSEPALAETCRVLERLCLERKRTELKQGVRRLLKDNPDTPRLLNRALDWYIRCGLSKEALHLIYADPKMKAGLKSPYELGTSKALYFMLLLSSHSGWPWVQKWLSKPPTLQSSREQVILGNILSRIGSPKAAFDLIIKAAPSGLEKRRLLAGRTEDAREAERRQDILGTLAQLCWKLEDHKKGLQYANEWLSILPAQDTYGRYHARSMVHYFEGQSGEPVKALQSFKQALSEAPDCRKLAPRIFRISLLWRARIETRAGLLPEALATLKQAMEVTQREIPGYSPIQMTEILCEKLRLGIITPAELHQLSRYPSLPKRDQELVERSIQKPAQLPAFDPSSLEGTTWWISPRSDEYQRDGTLNCGIPLEISLLALLSRAGEFGIHRNLAMALLWPEQWMILPQLDERLTKLTKRLRAEHGFTVLAERDCLFLGEKDCKRVIVDIERDKPTFLDQFSHSKESTFTWQQIAEHYSMKATPARDLIAQWLEAGRIHRMGAGPSTRYRKA